MFFIFFFFFFNDTATTEIYTSIDTLSLHDALPIWWAGFPRTGAVGFVHLLFPAARRSEEHTSELQSPIDISYAVFCLKKKKNNNSFPDMLKMDMIPAALEQRRRMSGYLTYGGQIELRLRGFRDFFFFNDTATTEIYTSIDTLSLHDALPISRASAPGPPRRPSTGRAP